MTTFFGRQPVSVVGAVGSPWLAAHVPAHAHEWGWSGTTMTYHLYGHTRGCGEPHPVWSVTPEEQARFMERATAEEIEGFYAGLKSPDLAVRRSVVQMACERAMEDGR